MWGGEPVRADIEHRLSWTDDRSDRGTQCIYIYCRTKCVLYAFLKREDFIYLIVHFILLLYDSFILNIVKSYATV